MKRDSVCSPSLRAGPLLAEGMITGQMGSNPTGACNASLPAMLSIFGARVCMQAVKHVCMRQNVCKCAAPVVILLAPLALGLCVCKSAGAVTLVVWLFLTEIVQATDFELLWENLTDNSNHGMPRSYDGSRRGGSHYSNGRTSTEAWNGVRTNHAQ